MIQENCLKKKMGRSDVVGAEALNFTVDRLVAGLSAINQINQSINIFNVVGMLS